MKHVKNLFLLSALGAAFILQSCDKNDPEDPKPAANKQEVITTVKLLLVDTVTNETITAQWKDLDADGPGQPVVSTLNLKPGKGYVCEILLLDESKSPVDTVSNEIKREAEAHQFFYTVTGTATLNINKVDVDANRQPLGLISTIQTGSSTGTGTLKVVLRHYDGINKSNDPQVGETDVEAEFPLEINN